jgi:hypothetical protein
MGVTVALAAGNGKDGIMAKDGAIGISNPPIPKMTPRKPQSGQFRRKAIAYL